MELKCSQSIDFFFLLLFLSSSLFSLFSFFFSLFFASCVFIALLLSRRKEVLALARNSFHLSCPFNCIGTQEQFGFCKVLFLGKKNHRFTVPTLVSVWMFFCLLKEKRSNRRRRSKRTLCWRCWSPPGTRSRGTSCERGSFWRRNPTWKFCKKHYLVVSFFSK